MVQSNVAENDAPAYREIESQIEATLRSAPVEGPNAETEEAFVPPQVSEERRLSKKPSIDHLIDGVIKTEELGVVPLFGPGDRIIAERHLSILDDHRWLDTRIYIVQSIDDDMGIVHCQDEEQRHYACIGFKHPFTRIKLVPKKGNPWKVTKIEKPLIRDGASTKKGRGRPKGSKNRDKETIKAEKAAKRAAKGAK
jgi:hypothetical protein